MSIRDSSSEQSHDVAGTPSLTQHYVHPGVSPTPDETFALAPGQRDRWYPAKDVARALKDYEK
ncbi:hypothetical protein H5410_056127 [Solanum commersonii]|uniref:Uncharacterized protein n=1 Tax=Solanum commersonii TaxID=4109 RepID=A0A9J5WJE8_SOLCO|nr:hypothetical protein H5410_056127 [Solanum commersonii]